MPLSRRAIAIALAVLAIAETGGTARAADYFGMDLTGAVFAAAPLGPPEPFKAPALATPPVGARPVATIDEPAKPARQAGASSRLRHRNPLDAFAYAPAPRRARPCAVGRVCVWDGKLDRWRAP